MCGIIGIQFSGGRPADCARDRLSRGLEAIAHRGPDGHGISVCGSAAFGHRRLSIVGIEDRKSRQPTGRDDALLTYNGEIYNYRELSRELTEQGFEVSETSDTDVLFSALQNWGVRETLNRIDGMFAFAYRAHEGAPLYLVRDALGEKPLYWTRDGEAIWFASEIKALLRATSRTVEPNMNALDEFFFSSKVSGRETFFSGVYEVIPGTFLRIDSKGLHAHEEIWFDLEDLPDSGDRQGVVFEEQLDAAIVSRMVADVPYGVLLSGGLDSCTILQRACALGADIPQTFFADNLTADVSERKDVHVMTEYMAEAGYDIKNRSKSISLQFDQYINELASLSYYYDEPIQFYNSPLLGALCKSARQAGIKVLLSGEGSDELLYGYDRFRRSAATLTSSRDRRRRTEELFFGGGQHSVDLIVELVGGTRENIERSTAWQWASRRMDDMEPNLLQMLFSQKFRLQTLLQRQDRIGMSAGVEIRVPFLRPEFVRYVNGLPFEDKYDARTGTTKVALRRAMRNRLPKRLLRKPKQGFPSEMMVWLRTGEAAEYARTLAEPSTSFCSSYLNKHLVMHLLNEHRSNIKRHDVLVWRFIALEMWHRSVHWGKS